MEQWRWRRKGTAEAKSAPLTEPASHSHAAAQWKTADAARQKMKSEVGG